MKHLRWQIFLGISLISLSAVFYFIHFKIFHDLHHIFIYLLGDIAFVFLEVLIVTLVLHQVLELKDKNERLKKMNMVIGTFFSEVGLELIDLLVSFDSQSADLSKHLLISADWSVKKFIRVRKALQHFDFKADSHIGDLGNLRKFLIERRSFLLQLLGNPNLLEHDSFTNLLWAVFHLTEELEKRRDFSDLTENDLKHLSGDIKRAYSILIREWLDYMKHLKIDYPYLYSLAVRTNPFDENASVVVK